MFGKKTCSNCILPGDFPGADFDEDGVCSPCRDYKAGEGPYGWKNKGKIEQMKEDFPGLVEEAKDVDGYNCLVPISGGKDSAYLAKKAFDWGLKPLLFSVDTGFHPDLAHENMLHEVMKLRELYGNDIEHIFTKGAERYRGLRTSLKKGYRQQLINPDDENRIRSVCYKCGPLLMDLAMDVATRESIPLVLMGYSPGQAVDFFFYKLGEDYINTDHSNDWMKGDDFTDDDRKWSWNPHNYPDGTKFPIVAAPLHVLPYNEKQVVGDVVKYGLIPSKLKAHPAFTNCDLNMVLILAGLLEQGYNPHRPEFSGLIREGRARRTGWLATFAVVDWAIQRGFDKEGKDSGKWGFKKKDIQRVLGELDLDMEQIIQH